MLARTVVSLPLFLSLVEYHREYPTRGDTRPRIVSIRAPGRRTTWHPRISLLQILAVGRLLAVTGGDRATIYIV